MYRDGRNGQPSEIFVVAVLIIFTVLGGALALGFGLAELGPPATAGPGQRSAVYGCGALPGVVADQRSRRLEEAASDGENALPADRS